MTFSQYRDTLSWREAIDLGPELMRLAEELPAAEEMGLSWHLRQLMVEVPASVAGDLMKGAPASLVSVLKLVSVLELIDRVYPALDTSAVRNSADALLQRLSSDQFTETLGSMQGPAAASPQPAADQHPESGDAELTAPADTPLTPAEDTAGPAAATRTSVAAAPVTPAAPAPGTTPAAAAPAASAPEETDVHPNSV